MPFPTTLNPASPAGTDSPGQGDDQIRALKQLLVDLFGLPIDPTQLTAAPFAIAANGAVTVGVSLNLNSKPLINAPAPVNPNDVARKADVDLKVTKTGDTMTGNLTMFFNQPTIHLQDNLSGGEYAIQAALNRIYIYKNIGTHASPSFQTLYSLSPTGSPVDPADLTPKVYVDAFIASLANSVATLEAALNALDARVIALENA